MRSLILAFELLVLAVGVPHSQAQSVTDLKVFRGLSPVTALGKSDPGRSALRANYRLTGDIETGNSVQPTLLPFAAQEQQALRDAFITSRNLVELADGLGTTLGAAYVAKFHYIDHNRVSQMPPAFEKLVNYAVTITLNHANTAKFFFANETQSPDGAAVSTEAKAIFDSIGGTPDIFGVSYGLPAGSVLGDKYGNARPFLTEHTLHRFSGPDYFNLPSDNIVYNFGPAMPLVDSPSYPSGHTTYGYAGAIILGLLVPERYSQMITRGAEYGNNRILMGSHYIMDVMGGRALALYDMAHLLANDKLYMNVPMDGASTISDFRATLVEARNELADVLSQNCGDSVRACAGQDMSRFNNEQANSVFYESTQTYGLPIANPKVSSSRVDVGKVAPEAGYLLTVAFPSLSLAEADRILTDSEGPGGGFLDDGSDPSFAVYARIDLYASCLQAASILAGKK